MVWLRTFNLFFSNETGHSAQTLKSEEKNLQKIMIILQNSCESTELLFVAFFSIGIRKKLFFNFIGVLFMLISITDECDLNRAKSMFQAVIVELLIVVSYSQ